MTENSRLNDWVDERLDRGPSPFEDMTDVMAANKRSGRFWFSPATMSWFDSRVESGLIRGRYFITSNNPFDSVRRFQVHYAQDDGSIETFVNPGPFEAGEPSIGFATQALAMEWLLQHDQTRASHTS